MGYVHTKRIRYEPNQLRQHHWRVGESGAHRHDTPRGDLPSPLETITSTGSCSKAGEPRCSSNPGTLFSQTMRVVAKIYPRKYTLKSY